MHNKKPGGLLGAGTEESDCVLEIRERDEKSSMAGPQQETLLEQHQGFRCHELQIQQSCRQKLSTHTFRFSVQIHTSVLSSTFVHKGWWIRSWPLMDDFLSLSYQFFLGVSKSVILKLQVHSISFHRKSREGNKQLQMMIPENSCFWEGGAIKTSNTLNIMRFLETVQQWTQSICIMIKVIVFFF